MGNLYEQTQIMQIITDLIVIEPKGKPKDYKLLKDKLDKLPKYTNPIDSSGTVFWHVDDQPVRKKKDEK